MSSPDLTQDRLQELKENGLKWLLAPAALILLYLFFGIFGRNFFSYASLVNIIDAAYYIGFIAVGVTFVIIGGGIDLSVGAVMMAAAITGGTAYTTWGWPMWAALILVIAVGVAFGYFNGILITRLKMPPFIVTLGTMMISMGAGSIVSNVQSATFPTRSSPDGWFKSIFKIINQEGATVPTGAFVLLAVVIISHIILNNTKMGRYVYAMGSNKEAARLSGVDVKKWEMMTYVIAGTYAGIGGISYAALYTTVLPSQGQGFELLAIAGAVIGGTSLAGGVGTVFGTLIGVLIMSVLSVGLPAMDLQSHYQTFFTGVVVIGAVLLDLYRSRKAAEVKVTTPADEYKTSTQREIHEMKEQLRAHKKAGRQEEARKLKQHISDKQKELEETFQKMKAEEKEEQERIRQQERAAEREFQEMLKKRSESQQKQE